LRTPKAKERSILRVDPKKYHVPMG
jgi:hypothetical protein